VTTEPIDSISKKIIKRYNTNPVGWTIFRDHKGTMLISGPNNDYVLKLIGLNPHEYTGVGMRIKKRKGIQKLTNGAPQYGYRPIPTSQVRELLDSLQNLNKQNTIITKLLESEPLTTWQLKKRKPSLVLNGPILAHPDLSSISKSQRKLDLKLKIEAQKFFNKKYPYRAEMYR
jgi:hypothetical protein